MLVYDVSLLTCCIYSKLKFGTARKTKQKGAPAQGKSIPGYVPAQPIAQNYIERAMKISRAIYWNTVHQV